MQLQAGGELVGLWADGEAERVAAVTRRPPTDPEYVAHWTQVLFVLAAAGDAIGGRGLIYVVSSEVRVISRYAASATGRVAADFLVTKARWLEFGRLDSGVNQGERARGATAWLKQSGELETQAKDSMFGAYVLMRRSQRAREQGSPAAALK